LAGRGRIRCKEVFSRGAAAKRLIWTFVHKVDLSANPEPSKIHDYIGALGRAHKELTQHCRLREKAAFRTNLPEG
jgi:hypothetical protein